MPFLPPNQQRQSTEGTSIKHYLNAKKVKHKPAAVACSGRQMGQTDRQRDGQTEGNRTVPLHKLCRILPAVTIMEQEKYRLAHVLNMVRVKIVTEMRSRLVLGSMK